MKPPISLEHLFADLIEQTHQHNHTLPPVHQWHPEKTGDMDLRIDREGRWLHESVEIKRPAIVALFSSLLKVEDTHYFLVTPTEKWQIQVDIAPFFVVDAKRIKRGGIQGIVLTTRTNEQVLLCSEHPLKIEKRPPHEPVLPLVQVRDNLNALVSRAVYYQLVEWGSEQPTTKDNNQLMLESMGCHFSLGDLVD
jgi:hypothetical protein